VGALRSGLIFAALIIPVFVFRHYLQDKGQFPPSMVEDLEIGPGQKMVRRAGIWPYVTLVLAVAVLIVTHALARY
jgi:hypothetical protein